MPKLGAAGAVVIDKKAQVGAAKKATVETWLKGHGLKNADVTALGIDANATVEQMTEKIRGWAKERAKK